MGTLSIAEYVFIVFWGIPLALIALLALFLFLKVLFLFFIGIWDELS